MKSKWLKNIIALAAVFALLFPAGALAGAGEELPGILALLSYIPALSFAPGTLSFVDIPALIAGTPGTVMPESVEGFERITGTPAGDAVLQAYMGVSAGPPDVFRNLPQSREMLTSSGIDYFHIRQMLEIGSPPLRQIWLSGNIDKAAILDKLQARGYQATPNTLPDREVWGKGGDIGSGLKMDLRQRDAHFPFGGSLGQSWPVIFAGKVIGATPDEKAIQAVAFESGPSLAAPGPIADMVMAAMMKGENEWGALAQLHLLTPSAAGTNLPGISSGSPEPASGTEPLPPYTLLSLSQVFSIGAQWVLIGLSYPDAAAAAAAEPVIMERLSQAKLARTGGFLSEKIKELGGRLDPFFTVPGESGSHILVIPFRFPKSAEGPDNVANPYRFFANLLQVRDFGWINIGNWGL